MEQKENYFKDNGLGIAAIIVAFSAMAYTFYSDLRVSKKEYSVKTSIDSLKHRVQELEEINSLNNKKIKYLQSQHPGSEKRSLYK